jgi:hypothetical protein
MVRNIHNVDRKKSSMTGKTYCLYAQATENKQRHLYDRVSANKQRSYCILPDSVDATLVDTGCWFSLKLIQAVADICNSVGVDNYSVSVFNDSRKAALLIRPVRIIKRIHKGTIRGCHGVILGYNHTFDDCVVSDGVFLCDCPHTVDVTIDWQTLEYLVTQLEVKKYA